MDRLDSELAPRFSPWWLVAPLLVSAAVRDLWAPDEPRYAMVAKWVYDHGEFLILRRCGELYPDKPPFLYWASGLLGWLSGWSVFAMRLVSVVATVLTAWMVRKLARRWLGELEAAWAPVLFLGFALVGWHGARLQLDPALMAACTGALVLASAPAASAREASRNALLAGLCTGVAAFDKGPVAFLNVGLPLVLWRAFGLARGPRASRPAFAAALALAVVPVAAWAGLASYVEPSLARPLFFGQHLGRAVSGERHRGPPWEPLLEMPLYLLPWTVPVVLGLASAFRDWRARRRGAPHSEGRLRAGLWLAGLFVFFSAIPAKRELYLLPAYPACALLGACALAEGLRGARVGRWAGWVPLALLGAFASAGLATAASLVLEPDRVVRWAKLPADGLAWRAALVGLVFALGTLLVWRARARAAHTVWARRVALAWCAGVVLAYALVLAPVDRLKSDRATAELLRSLGRHPSEIPFYGVGPDGVRFYDGGPCVPVETTGLEDGDIERRLSAQGEQFLAVVQRADWERLAPERKTRFALLAERRTGGDDYVVLGRP